MEHKTNSVESLFENADKYFETNINLLKLKAIDKSSGVFSAVSYGIIILSILFLIIIFAGIGIAFYIGDELGKTYYGFLIVAGFYIVTGVVLHVFRNQLIKEPLDNLFIKGLLN